MKKAMILAAHPDDETLGCGGIIDKFKETVEFKVVFIAEGTSCRYEECEECSEDILKNIKNREDSAKKALQGIDVSFYNLPCGKLDIIPQLTINKIIEKEIRNFCPDTVFTHWFGDLNTDHRKIYDATMIATRPNTCSVKNVLCYEVLSTTECNFRQPFEPNCFYALTAKNIEAKCNNMLYYTSECQKYPSPRSTESIKALSIFRGTQSGCEFAESFKIVRKIL